MPTAGVDLPRALGGRREEATTPSLSCSQAACAPGLGPAEGAGPVGQLMKAQSRVALVGLEEGLLMALEACQHRVEARGPIKRP